MARKGFYYARGPETILPFIAKTGATIAVGDMVIKDDATGTADIAVAGSTSLLGVAVSSVSSAAAETEIRVSCNPDTEYIGSCSGTSSAALKYDYVDLEGATTNMQINEDATSTQVLQLMEPVSAVGASAEHYVKISRHALGEKVGTALAADIADNAVTTAKILDANVTADKLAAAVAGDGLAGGAGTALSVNVDDTGIEINSDTLRLKDAGVTAAKLNADALTATKIPDYSEGVEHIPFFVSKLLTATAGTYTICTAAFKFRVVDWWVIKRDTTASNVKLNDGSNDMSANVASGTTDDALVRGGTIIAEYDEIAASGTLKAITDGNSAMEVCALCIPVA